MNTDPVIPETVHAAIADGDLDAAIESFQTELSVNPSPKLAAEYAFFLWSHYDYEGATEAFGHVIRNDSTPPQILQRIARAWFRVGRFADAAKVMEIATERSPENLSEYLEQWASCLERSQQEEKGIEIAHRALRLDPSSARAIRLLAHIDRRNGQFEQAVQRIEDHLTQYPGDWDWGLRYELAASLDRLGDYEQAWQALVLAKEQLRNEAIPHLQQSMRIRQRQGELVQRITRTDLKNWQRTDPGSAPPQRIAFLAGFPRSGTTLLEQILTAQSDCIGTDETGILTQQFTRPIVWQAETTFDALLEIRAFENDQIAEGRKAYLQFTESYIGETIGSRLLIEKDPLLTCDLILPLRLFPEARLIMPLRDPRDVLVSYFFTMVPFGWNSSPAIDIMEAAKFYHDVMRHWLYLKPRLPWPTLETRYEDLVADQVSETQKLTRFLGLTFDPSMLDVNKRSAEKAVSTPTYDDVTRPIYRRSLARWKHYEKQLEPALEILEPYIKAFGYQ